MMMQQPLIRSDRVAGDVCTFQDHDGSHIKGLIINLLHHIWPGLLQIDGFLTEFVTPIVKVPTGTLVLWALWDCS